MAALAWSVTSFGADAEGKRARWSVPPKVAQECGLAADQAGSFLIPAFTLPVSVWIDPSFNSSQVQLIRESIAEWNRFGERQYGRALFAIDAARSVAAATLKKWKASIQYCRSNDTANGTGLAILRETSTHHWVKGLGFSATIPAVAMRCTYGDGKKAQGRHWILVQTEMPESQAPFKVWVIHELGHVLGLNHSCDSASSAARAAPEWRSCNGLKKGDSYRQAVLYPYSPTSSQPFEIDAKQRLGGNDQRRLGCLLEGLKDVSSGRK